MHSFISVFILIILWNLKLRYYILHLAFGGKERKKKRERERSGWKTKPRWEWRSHILFPKGLSSAISLPRLTDTCAHMEAELLPTCHPSKNTRRRRRFITFVKKNLIFLHQSFFPRCKHQVFNLWALDLILRGRNWGLQKWCVLSNKRKSWPIVEATYHSLRCYSFPATSYTSFLMLPEALCVMKNLRLGEFEYLLIATVNKWNKRDLKQSLFHSKALATSIKVGHFLSVFLFIPSYSNLLINESEARVLVHT